MKKEKPGCSPCHHRSGYICDDVRNGVRRVGICILPLSLAIISVLSSCLWHFCPISSPVSLPMRISLVFVVCSLMRSV